MSNKNCIDYNALWVEFISAFKQIDILINRLEQVKYINNVFDIK